jgi:hypothetical protein
VFLKFLVSYLAVGGIFLCSVLLTSPGWRADLEDILRRHPIIHLIGTQWFLLLCMVILLAIWPVCVLSWVISTVKDWFERD